MFELQGIDHMRDFLALVHVLQATKFKELLEHHELQDSLAHLLQLQELVRTFSAPQS